MKYIFFYFFVFVNISCTFVAMDAQLPLKWTEKLEALELNKSLPVANPATVYSAIRAIKGSGKEFTIRKHRNGKKNVWRIK